MDSVPIGNISCRGKSRVDMFYHSYAFLSVFIGHLFYRNMTGNIYDTALAWLEAEGNLIEGGLTRLIGSGALPYYSSTEFESTLAVYWK